MYISGIIKWKSTKYADLWKRWHHRSFFFLALFVQPELMQGILIYFFTVPETYLELT